MTPIEGIAIPSREEFEEELRSRFRPFVLRGIASDWPLVKAGRDSAETALSLIERHDSGAPTDIMVAPPSEQGRFFYAPDMRGFNFQRQKGTLSQLAGQLRASRTIPARPAFTPAPPPRAAICPASRRRTLSR